MFIPRLKVEPNVADAELVPAIVSAAGSMNSSITGVLLSTDPSDVVPRAAMVQMPADPLVTVKVFAVPVETPV
jgi:hypothetical protein